MDPWTALAATTGGLCAAIAWMWRQAVRTGAERLETFREVLKTREEQLREALAKIESLHREKDELRRELMERLIDWGYEEEDSEPDS